MDLLDPSCPEEIRQDYEEEHGRILDCGHRPNRHGAHTTGTGHTADGREICWDCCNREEAAAFAVASKFTAYLSGDGQTITTWSGGHLARVTVVSDCSDHWNGRIRCLYVRAVTPDGAHWYGRATDRGMLCRLHRNKEKR